MVFQLTFNLKTINQLNIAYNEDVVLIFTNIEIKWPKKLRKKGQVFEPALTH